MALSSPWFKNDPVFQKAAVNAPPMKTGDVGEAVRYLQQALIELGLKLPDSTKKHGSPDGDYGAETKAKVKEFQRANGLAGEADGRVGTNTLAKLDAKMVALGRPRPTLPPLGGGPAPAPVELSQMAKDVVAVLREAMVGGINFRYGTTHFVGTGLAKVAEAIEQGRIRVACEDGLTGFGEYVHFNDVEQKNQFNFKFDTPRGSLLNRSVVVHEAVHAHQDILGVGMDKYVSEGIAFTAQAIYLAATLRRPGVPPELIGYSAVDVIIAAFEEIKESLENNRGRLALGGNRIKAALERLPEYQRMVTPIAYDGVP